MTGLLLERWLSGWVGFSTLGTSPRTGIFWIFSITLGVVWNDLDLMLGFAQIQGRLHPASRLYLPLSPLPRIIAVIQDML